MKKSILICLLAASLFECLQTSAQSLLTREQVGAACMPQQIAPIEAPFDMPQLRRNVFPDLTVTVKLKKADKKGLITPKVQAAIDEVNAKGGGTVVIPQGEWNTGRIILKSNVNLNIPEGVTLNFSERVEDYLPVVFTRSAGIEGMSTGALIYAFEQDNIAITGGGLLVGPPMDAPLRKASVNYGNYDKDFDYSVPPTQRFYDGVDRDGKIFAPTFIGPVRCTNVLIEGVSLLRSPFWNVVPTYCENVIIRGINVESETPWHIDCGDGMDIESCKNILIEYCTVNTGDDGFTIKSGRGEDGLRVNKPTENLVIRYCLAKKCHGGVTCGSETAGMIRDVYVHDCVFDGSSVGIRFKTRRPRGGGGENLYYERITMNNVGSAIRFDMLGSAIYVGNASQRVAMRRDQFTPVYRNITISDLDISNANYFLNVTGIPESPAMNVRIQRVKSSSKRLMALHDINNLVVHDCQLTSDENIIDILDGRNITFSNLRFTTTDGTVKLKTDGSLTENNRFVDCSPMPVEM
ncbi:MAG: glycoside hydrolase family 28 protein [Prevotella sp.]|nr:glycoside hydrolase family 28 protein [Prevotella sp.]